MFFKGRFKIIELYRKSLNNDNDTDYAYEILMTSCPGERSHPCV